jgi:lysophospholipid hydrolase
MSHSQRSRPSTKSNRAGPSRQPYPRPETYVHSSTTSDLHHWDSDDDESMSSTSGGGGYQLINEVERGGTLSSLFTILSLFTEDVEISWGAQEETGDGMNDLRRFRRKGNSFEDDDHEGITFGRGPGGGQSSTSRSTSDWDIPKLNLPASSASTSPIPQEGTMHAGEVVDSPQAIQGPVLNAQVIIGSPPATPSEAGTARSTASQSNTQIPSSPSTLHNFTPVPHQSRSHSRHRDGYDTDADPYAHEGGRGGRRKETANVNTYKALRGIVARASEDTTLAVIPAEAFRRVTKKFPKASAHIVQGLLTCFHFSCALLTKRQ